MIAHSAFCVTTNSLQRAFDLVTKVRTSDPGVPASVRQVSVTPDLWYVELGPAAATNWLWPTEAVRARVLATAARCRGEGG